MVEWAEEIGGGGWGCNSFNILLGFKPLWPMVTGDTRGTTTGCVSPEGTVNKGCAPIGDFPRVSVERVDF